MNSQTNKCMNELKELLMDGRREPDISPQLTSRPLGHLAPLDASPLPIRHLAPHMLDTSPQSIIIMI